MFRSVFTFCGTKQLSCMFDLMRGTVGNVVINDYAGFVIIFNSELGFESESRTMFFLLI